MRRKAKAQDYRKFRIKSVQGPNDYASMEEVLTRRFTHESNGELTAFQNAGSASDGWWKRTGKYSTGCS